MVSKTDDEQDRRQALRVLERVTSNVLSKLAPHVSTTSVRKSEMREALARMVRDAQKGTPTYPEYYDLSRLRFTLEQLGKLEIEDYAVWYWAREYNWQRESVRGDEPYNPMAFRLWEQAIDGLDGPPEARLQFASLSSGHIVLVHPDARLKDSIYQLDQCQLLVVVREDDYGQKTLVGEACIQKSSNGTWFSGRRIVHSLGSHAGKYEKMEVLLVPRKPSYD